MSKQAKFLLSCFIGCVILWLVYIGGLVIATVFVVRLAENVSGWMTGIWGGGSVVAIIAVVLLGMLANETRRSL
ncbi:hypothetical protein PP301_gp076 [Gordonia phage GMA2]|uniref:Uncharacterized protein n=1 Tax=Gordonia phage GMA2 TaxID=1647283 RepID=A0A0K0N7J8_9CAUD|nr:hypothetical protein PP301_gp076 [Gordonia phage GMA2]AKJ72646.1 hypothetical protein GMA2_108 [Gordonia phage GMA2]